jgi:hypothetical protein
MLVNKLLSGAVKLWLKSQVSEVKDLKINIVGNSKQILTGEIPEVNVCANDAVYQELRLSKLNVRSTKIKFDLSSILNKKQFKLSEAIIIDITVFSLVEDLQNSLSSLLLNSVLTDIWYRFLVSNSINIKEHSHSYCWNYLSLFQEGIEFKGVEQKSGKDDSLIRIKTNIKSIDEHFLLLTPVEIEHNSEFYPKNFLPLTFDLGKQVSINQLEITQEHLFLQGQITIYP